jgi:hypothetical protein
MIGVHAAYFCYPIAPGRLLEATARLHGLPIPASNATP